jgi:hypothetical protein
MANLIPATYAKTNIHAKHSVSHPIERLFEHCDILPNSRHLNQNTCKYAQETCDKTSTYCLTAKMIVCHTQGKKKVGAFVQ